MFLIGSEDWETALAASDGHLLMMLGHRTGVVASR